MNINLKKIFIILIIFLIVCSFFCVSAAALSDIVNPEDYRPGELSNSTKIRDIANVIIGVVQFIGTIVSILVLIVVGIKYMVGSVEEKAEYKETMMPYFIGAIMTFGIVNILGIVSSISGEIWK